MGSGSGEVSTSTKSIASDDDDAEDAEDEGSEVAAVIGHNVIGSSPADAADTAGAADTGAVTCTCCTEAAGGSNMWVRTDGEELEGDDCWSR
jgi:hypothetical protein